ncbi:hypothetical protein ACFXKD_05515 [Nocardiopsis aegyptia]|uniref:hypothetical protein n=1 Tax=Nocardiopsis aegyptia TaxID=220378 RepID=UPI003672EDFD
MDPAQPHALVEEDPIQADLERISRTSQQCSFIDSRPEPPKATSSLYIRQSFTQTSKDGPKHYTVTGVHIVLAKGQPNGLWEAFHIDRDKQTIDPKNPKVATGSLRICCDTLEVRGAFSLPEADVHIFARRLIWADEKASIDTSPLGWSVGKAQDGIRGSIRDDIPGKSGENGVHGRNAGSIRVFVHEVDATGTSDARFIARGGRGQAPGSGDEVDAKSSVTLKHPKPPRDWCFVDDGYLPASEYTVIYYANGKQIEIDWGWYQWRVFVDPGIPGDGGNGGTLTSNQSSGVLAPSNTGGAGGARERPIPHAAYVFTVTDGRVEVVEKSYWDHGPIIPAVGKTGETPKLISHEKSHAWVHPLGLQPTLDYVRDMFLSGAREQLREMLAIYGQALSQPRLDTGAWDGVESEWEAAQAEIATLLLRDAAHLDYFGNPAGYSPLLSLSGSIRLYGNETKRALRMMLISERITAADRSARETSAILDDTIGTVNADTRAAAAQVTDNEDKIGQVSSSLADMRKELAGLSGQLSRLRDKLLDQAQKEAADKARIRSFFKLAGALCQVIPVGQPALGAVGSLAAVASDFAGDSWETTPVTLSKLGDAVEKGGNAMSAAQKVAKTAGEGTAKTPLDWSKAGAAVSSGFSLASESMKTLQVPKSEVEAGLAKLQAESREWKDLTEKIRKANEKKVALFAELQAVMLAVGEGYSRLAANAGTVVRLQQQRNQQTASLDPEAVAAVQHMEQRSRRTLQKYLYLMVKSYEAAMLKKPTVNWQLPAVTKKIARLVGSSEEWDATKLKDNADVLDTVFEDTLSEIRDQLLQDYAFDADVTTTPFILSAKQDPAEIEALNSKPHRTVIDPMGAGLIEDDFHLARLRNVELQSITLDQKWSEMPEDFVLRLDLASSRKGILRRDDGLYVLTSESPAHWGWNCSPSERADGAPEIRPDIKSPDNEDILNFVLGKRSEKIKGKLSLVPAWSDLTLSVSFKQKPKKRFTPPRITRLRFTVEIDRSPAPQNQRVLTVLPDGGVGDEVISCSPDLADRGDGCGPMVRIYNKNRTVDLEAPARSGNTVFEGWTTEEGVEPATSARIELEDHVMVWPSWAPEPEGPAQVPAQARPGQAEARQVIRVEPDAASAAIGLIPRWGEADVVEQGTGWNLVHYRGVTGWVAST